MKARIFKHEIHITGKAIVMVIAFVIMLFVFGLLGHEIVVEKEDWFDSRTFHFFNSIIPSSFISLFRIVTFFGSIGFLVPAYILLIIFLVYRKRKIEALGIGVIAIVSTLLVFGLKNIYARTRPDLPLFVGATNYSFPSGHSLSSMVFCAVLIALIRESSLNRSWQILLSIFLLLFTLLIGISRIVLRFHYASDVVAGFCLGIACAILFFWLRRNLAVYSGIRQKNNPS